MKESAASPFPNPTEEYYRARDNGDDDDTNDDDDGVILVSSRDDDDDISSTEDATDGTGIGIDIDIDIDPPPVRKKRQPIPKFRYAYNYKTAGGRSGRRRFPDPPSQKGFFLPIDDGNREDGDDSDDGEGKHPRDSYSFLALYSPARNPLYFCFGLMAFLFQFAFLTLMILSVFDRSSGEFGDDQNALNPGTGFAASVFPANVGRLVRVTQITSILSFLVFADSTLLDLARAVEMIPPFWLGRKSGRGSGENEGTVLGVRNDDVDDETYHHDRGTGENQNPRRNRDWGICFACFLRFVQGLMAVFAVFLLVMTSSSVIDIVLNFTAVNFISALDDTAFALARLGKFGPDLRREAKLVEATDLPPHIASKRLRIWYTAAIVPTAIVLLGLTIAIVVYQERSDKWITTTFRVQFQDSTGLGSYSGCYHIDPSQRINKRYIYRSDAQNANHSSFGYCLETRRWLFFDDDDDDDDDSTIDPCDSDETELAHSARTTSFDVSTSFLEDWFSFFNTPLEMYFVRESDPNQLLDNCGSFVHDGVCDAAFNNFFYQYDGGDCCAPTCAGANCGASGDGDGDPRIIDYPDCNDPNLVSLGIVIGLVQRNLDPTWYIATIAALDGWEDSVTPLVELECDGTTIVKTPVAQIMSGTKLSASVDPASLTVGNCTLTTQHTNLLWTVEVFLEGNGKDAVERTSRNPIPPNVAALPLQTGLATIDLTGNGFTGTIPSEIGSSAVLAVLRLGNNELTGVLPTELAELESLRALNVSSNQFGGTFPWELCFRWTDLTELDFGDNALTGTLPTEIALLTSLTHLSLHNNSLYGLLPVELGALTNLKTLRLGRNSFFGTLPPGLLESLTDLETLDLGHNAFTGSLPVNELEMLANLRDVRASSNSFDGTIPVDASLGTGLGRLDLGRNSLDGPFPASMIRPLTNLEHLDLGGNEFSIAVVPFGAGVGVVVENDFLEDVFASLEKLRYLDLSGNDLGGTRLPNGLASTFSNLEYLDLGSVGIDGTIPSAIGTTLKHLRRLVVDGNTLTGTIPTEIGMLQDLEHLGLDGNRLKGSMPSQIGLLTNLHVLDVGRNALIGTIPTELGSLSDNLTEVWMYYNDLEGTIPCELELLSNLSAINLNFNRFTGPIPSGLVSTAGYVHAAIQKEGQLSFSVDGYCGDTLGFGSDGRGSSRPLFPPGDDDGSGSGISIGLPLIPSDDDEGSFATITTTTMAPTMMGRQPQQPGFDNSNSTVTISNPVVRVGVAEGDSETNGRQQQP